MRRREFALPIECCPVCGAKGSFQFKGRIDDIPFFGETLETLVTCSRCNFKQSDVLHLGEGKPTRYEFQISSVEDMKVRVVRSSTGVIKVPELGVVVRPGSGGQGYVSNIEGVLGRIKEAMEISMSGAAPLKRRTAERKLRALDAIMRGEKRARLIVMDPFGHSAIIGRRAEKRKLTRMEISELGA